MSADGPGFFRSRWVEPPTGRRGARSGRAGARLPGRRRRLRAEGGGGTDVGLVACDAAEVALGAAADPQRRRRGADPGLPGAMRRPRDLRAAVVNSGNANAATGEQGYARRARDARRGCAAALGLEPRPGRRRRDRDDRRAAADRRRCSRASTRPRRRCRADGRRGLRRRDHDHRPRARSAARVRAGGVTVSAQAKGAGMIEPGFATMLCFVQTDADRRRPRRRRCARRSTAPSSGSPSTAR